MQKIKFPKAKECHNFRIQKIDSHLQLMQNNSSQTSAQFQHLEDKIFNVAVRQLRISFLSDLAALK